jgi:hypothetical protein
MNLCSIQEGGFRRGLTWVVRIMVGHVGGDCNRKRVSYRRGRWLLCRAVNLGFSEAMESSKERSTPARSEVLRA